MKIILLVLVVTLSGCVQRVSPEMLEIVLKTCENNKGISKLMVDSRNSEDAVFYRVDCNDGYTVRLPVRLLRQQKGVLK